MDLIGYKVGKLTVVGRTDRKSKRGRYYWKCECKCGKTTEVCETSLLSKTRPTTSCGCARYENKFIDLTNKKFNSWTVIRHIKGGIWECECECGKRKNITVSNVVSGKSKSCGCKRKAKGITDNTKSIMASLIGTQRGNLTILGYSPKLNWKCQCKCGNIVYRPLDTLTDTTMCQECKNNLSVGKIFGDYLVLPDKIVKNRKSLWKCKCQKCGKEVYKRINGSLMLCRCSIKTPYPDWFIDDLYEEADKNLARLGQLRTSEYVNFYCPQHGVYKQAVYAHIRIGTQEQLHGCPHCSHSIAHSGSKPELEIKNYIEAISGKKFEKSRVLSGKEIDMYNDELKIGIEYNGSAFHATEGGIYTNKDKYYHRDKFIEAKKQCIHLITIFDIDYRSNKWRIFEILRHILIDKDNKFFIPQNNIEYTDNDYDFGEWMQEYGYKEIGQEEPDSYIYESKYLVYRCGKTKWQYNE